MSCRSILYPKILGKNKLGVIVQSTPGVGGYDKSQEFQGNDWIQSNLAELGGLQLSVQEILNPDE